MVDLRVMQLMCSRLCHDLIGAVSAAGTGLELLDETPPQSAEADEALKLVANGTRQAADRLAFFRMAFGLGGGDSVDVGEIRKLAEGLLGGGRVALDWPLEDSPAEVSVLSAKLVLNMVLLGSGALPRGGTLGVRLADLDGELGVAMTASGGGARIKEELQAAMSPETPVDELTAYNVHGHFAARLAASVGADIEMVEGPAGEVRLAALVPAGGGRVRDQG